MDRLAFSFAEIWFKRITNKSLTMKANGSASERNQIQLNQQRLRGDLKCEDFSK